MNITNLLDDNNNNNTLSTATLQSFRKYHVENPFNSWYIGGVLFLCTFLLGLLCANHYRENSCELFWMRIISRIDNTQSRSLHSRHSIVNHVADPVLV